jgi:Homeodomain-like domain
MRALTISDQETMIMALQDEIRRNDTSRYDHRLYGVLLVAQGMTCPQVAGLLGDSPRAVVNWIQRFEARGLAGQAVGVRQQILTGRPCFGEPGIEPFRNLAVRGCNAEQRSTIFRAFRDFRGPNASMV